MRLHQEWVACGEDANRLYGMRVGTEAYGWSKNELLFLVLGHLKKKKIGAKRNRELLNATSISESSLQYLLRMKDCICSRILWEGSTGQE